MYGLHNGAVVPFAELTRGRRSPRRRPVRPSEGPQRLRPKHGPPPEEERAEGPLSTHLLDDHDPADSSSHAEEFDAASSAKRNSFRRRELSIHQHQMPDQMHSRESPRPSHGLLLRKLRTL